MGRAQAWKSAAKKAEQNRNIEYKKEQTKRDNLERKIKRYCKELEIFIKSEEGHAAGELLSKTGKAILLGKSQDSSMNEINGGLTVIKLFDAITYTFGTPPLYTVRCWFRNIKNGFGEIEKGRTFLYSQRPGLKFDISSEIVVKNWIETNPRKNIVTYIKQQLDKLAESIK